jgi:hypothetical protein
MQYQITDLAMMDYMYEQNPDGTYIILENFQFKRRNLDVISDDFLEIIGSIFKKIIQKKQMQITKFDCDSHRLIQALTRSSRDIFGESRLKAKLNYIEKKGRITHDYCKSLCFFEDYGIKTDSLNPLLNRRVANLLYWLSVLKPFSIETPNAGIQNMGYMYDFSNEFVAYSLAMALVKTFGKKLDIHSQKHIFHDFLYDLHFRNISRSSLEFMLVDLKYSIK